MIDVTAQLIGGSVFLPGEKIVCWISFRNTADPTDTNATFENLALASAQIHCLCTTNSKVSFTSKAPVNPEPSSSHSNTSFTPYKGDSPGRIVLSTKPKILFCDITIPPGAAKPFIFTEVLPPEAPPSYRGKLVKYSYKITIGTQRVNRPIKLLRVPLRVLPISGLPDYNICEDSEDLSPSNPFLEKHNKEHELLPALQLVQNITARRSPNFYNITNSRGKVGRFCLFKQAYRLGEDIVGTFDFTKSTVPCMQFTVTLQCEERIKGEFLATTKQEYAATAYSKHHVVSLHLSYCQLNLPIPLHATPAFSSDIMDLNWKLHFEFVTALSLDMITSAENQYWVAPEILNIETMIWDLPIQIYPTIPMPEPTAQNKYYITL